MNDPRATPPDILEAYFDTELDPAALRRFAEVDDDTWVDFFRHYRDQMDANFVAQFLGDDHGTAGARLYFEPRMAHQWDATLRTLQHAATPMLGVRPDPGDADVTRAGVSRMLSPLKKHLLMADSLFLRDNFYYCFDMAADSAVPGRWQDDPNEASLVRASIRKLRAWLPILIELRPLLDSRALVFMPYWKTPTFPYDANGPGVADAMGRLRRRASDKPVSWQVDHSEVTGAWLNARLLGLDPVLPDTASFDYVADLYFDEERSRAAFANDMVSIDLLPFGDRKDISLQDLVKLRSEDDVFQHVRVAVEDCRTYITHELGGGTSQVGIAGATKTFLHDRLDGLERRNALRFVEDRPVAKFVVSLAIGAVLIPVALPAAVSLLAGALLTPELALRAQRRYDPEKHAISHLQTLL